jgi:hypothetical protein
MDEVELKDRSLVLHSMRHTFRTFAIESGIADDVRRALMGHDAEDEHAEYGEVTLRARFDAMSSYRIEGLELEALKAPAV